MKALQRSLSEPPSTDEFAWRLLGPISRCSVFVLAPMVLGLVLFGGPVSSASEPDDVLDLREAFATHVVALGSLAFPDLLSRPPQPRPHHAIATWIRISQSGKPIRLVIEPGTLITGKVNSLLVIDRVSFDLGLEAASFTPVELKAYYRWLPLPPHYLRSVYSMVERCPSLLNRVCALPAVQRADDRIRQAAMWLANEYIEDGKVLVSRKFSRRLRSCGKPKSRAAVGIDILQDEFLHFVIVVSAKEKFGQGAA